MMSNECTNFKPHQLRPDKCKFCFGERTRHKQPTGCEADQLNKSNTIQATSGSRQELPEKYKQVDSSSRNNSAKIEKNELKGGVLASSSSLLSDSTGQQAEKLASELRECLNERAKLRAQLEELRSSNESDKAKQVQAGELEELKGKCEQLERERDEVREELRNLEREVDEMQDSFKEEESEQFEQLKQELELSTKNCKILQIRLSKAERQYAQLEQVKGMLENQLDEWTPRAGTGTGAVKSSEPSSLSRQNADSFDLTQVSSSGESIKLPVGEYDQLLRDLSDLSERERDLQEQVRYSQEEAQLKGERLQAVEGENELLLAKLEQLTQRAKWLPSKQLQEASERNDLNEKPEELRLGLELAQAECSRLKLRCQELASAEMALKDCDSSRAKLEFELAELRAACASGSGGAGELECRKLRARLVRSERQCRQLQMELDHRKSGAESGSGVELSGKSEQLAHQCNALQATKVELERQVGRLRGQSQSELEDELVGKLKRQLETSEAELARARSRLVELDLECGRAQRQQRRLLESLDCAAKKQPTRRFCLPPEHEREVWGRQELRQALSELEAEADELAAALKARECLDTLGGSTNGNDSAPCSSLNDEGQVQQLRHQLDSERQANEQLRNELSKLESSRAEFELGAQRMLEGERAAASEELEQLRKMNAELRAELDETRASERSRLGNAQANIERLRRELAAASAGHQPETQQQGGVGAVSEGNELLIRDLGELRAKSAFLARELENAREESARQLSEQRELLEARERRAGELAKLELREQQLAESQRLRDELAQAKQRVSASQRAALKAEEEAASEREKTRAIEREARREKGQLQQRLEQLEGSLSLERRAGELRLKEIEASDREKERELMAHQERIVQLERELKRTATKLELLEQQEKQSSRELDSARRQLAEFGTLKRARENELDELSRAHSAERATLLEALECVKRSYDESLSELRSTRERVARLQNESFRVRQANQERLEEQSAELARQAELAGQAKLLRQQLETSERQVESQRRELAQAKEEKTRLRTKCEQLERKCQRYERQELATKASSITSSSLFRALSSREGNRKSSGSELDHQQQQLGNNRAFTSATSPTQTEQNDETNLVEQLSGKISDQRRLAQLLRRQTEELQGELRKEKLARAAERAKLQAQLTQLSARLNEADERALLECEQNLSQETRAFARSRLESKWASERENSLTLIGQQQAQTELLERDLSRLSQAHELLRLQAKQLESQNSKLARRLIEYQQQQQLAPIPSEAMTRARQVESRLEQLQRQNARLISVLREEARPLVTLTSRLVEGLDSVSEKAGTVSSKASSSELNNSKKTLATPPGDSTKRPLLTTASPQPPDLISDSQPRFSRFLLIGRKPQDTIQVNPAGDSPTTVGDSSSQTATGAGKKGVKKVRSKWASLGVSASERQQLRRHLEALAASIEELESEEAARIAREKSSGHDALTQQQQPRVVRWRPNTVDTSDLDSNASSLVSPTLESSNSSVSKQYGRFSRIQPVRGSTAASLTDYESEDSLASDLSVPRSRLSLGLGGGADSDGGAGVTTSGTKKASKRRGLKTRLTSTLRSISRSITALTSDSEQENSGAPSGSSSKQLAASRKLGEIRV